MPGPVLHRLRKRFLVMTEREMLFRIRHQAYIAALYLPSVLSRGDDYKNHNKCISEDQKYGGKGFEAKANKGEVKQQQWIEVKSLHRL